MFVNIIKFFIIRRSNVYLLSTISFETYGSIASFLLLNNLYNKND